MTVTFLPMEDNGNLIGYADPAIIPFEIWAAAKLIGRRLGISPPDTAVIYGPSRASHSLENYFPSAARYPKPANYLPHREYPQICQMRVLRCRSESTVSSRVTLYSPGRVRPAPRAAIFPYARYGILTDLRLALDDHN
ncbi:hypothetical protein MESS4_830193 [Mesorhizobium sp. STM 4661]|nr:hypothetical protein MESS4_830193 [Mesorhizobium sp. STM 4661]